jgi:hypothetical protein
MTWRFGSGGSVIPNLFRDLVFGFENSGFGSLLTGWGSLPGICLLWQPGILSPFFPHSIPLLNGEGKGEGVRISEYLVSVALKTAQYRIAARP